MDYFGGAKSLKHLLKMQVVRYGNNPNAHYSDVEKVVALTLFYSCGNKGYRCLKDFVWYVIIVPNVIIYNEFIYFLAL